MKARAIRLRRQPVGVPKECDFEVIETDVAEPGPGQVLVRNLFLSVDPYQRNRMRAGLGRGEVVEARCIGEVAQSRDPAFRPGDIVLNNGGWRELLVCYGEALTPVDPEVTPVQAHLGVAGMPGLTAYVGLLLHGQPRAGETVFVSAAAGAVGSLVCQLAKMKGCRVVGSAGSEQKAGWLKEQCGVDAAINYRGTGDLSGEIRRYCPDGIDLLFENVGNAQFDAALDNMRLHGRIVLCGLIGRINATAPKPSIANLEAFITKRLSMRGFVVSDHLACMRQFQTDLKRWLAEDRVRWKETVLHGIENVPSAFVGLFGGQNFGKMLVRVDSRTGT